MSIYLLQSGNQTGPFPLEQLHQSVQTGLVPGDTLAWTEGLSEWVPVSSLVEGYTAAKPAAPIARRKKKTLKKEEDSPWWVYVLKGVVAFVIGSLLIDYVADLFLVAKKATKAVSAAQAATSAPAGHLELVVTKVVPLSFGDQPTATQCIIQATNRTSTPVRLVSFDVQGLDSTGAIVANSTKSLENLEPKQTRKVEVTFFSVLPGKISRINAVVRSATLKKPDGTLANAQTLAVSMVPFDEAHGNVPNLEAVRKHAPGTWTGNDNRGALLRLVMNPDGTTTEFMAHPTNENWGKGTAGRWEPMTSKYNDSGKRYFGVQLSRGGYTIFESATEMTLPNLRMTLTKGDQFPFSK